MHIIAIDGPAGSGKSSVSKAAARALGFGYLDTGAAYRALAWAQLNRNLQVGAMSASQIAEVFDYKISLDPSNYWVQFANVDITDAIREPEVAQTVSSIAVLPQVRAFMLQYTRDLVTQSGITGIVVEGRDITTVIFPEAETRILLTASEEVRIRRRQAELPADVSIADQVTKRDNTDSQVVDFMKPAIGVIAIDSSNLSFDETVSAVLVAVKGKKL